MTDGRSERLARGRWSADVRGDEIADICFDGVYLLRAVRPVVRDRDWNTVPVEVVGQHASDAGSTLVTRVLFADADIRYEASISLRLRDDELVVDFDGRALAGFERNRTGLVVLHPAADAGQAVRVVHTDGSSTAGSWPVAISPHQPFRDVAGFEWSKDGVTATLGLIGDVFETEDQRNWTDASFKTYSTPLSRPFPVTVAAGTPCRQGVRLTVAGRASRRSVPVTAGSRDSLTISSTPTGSLPPIGLGACLHGLPARLPAIPHGFETVLVELTGDGQRWPEQLRSAALQAEAAAAPLDVRIVTPDADAAGRCIAGLAGLPVGRLGVFDPHTHISTPALWSALREGANSHGFTGQLVGGTRAHFTELNRQIEQIPGDVPVVTFSITPQMHATETPHLIDSLAMQRIVAENALRLAGGRPVLVGPITLARRFNAVATTAAPDPALDALRAVDARQATGFAGAWTLGSVASLTAAGVTGLCYFETCGPRGVVGPDGSLTPAGRVLSTLARLRSRPVLGCAGPVDLPAVAVLTGTSVEVLVANLAATRRTVVVHGPGPGQLWIDVEGWSVAWTTIPAG